MNARSFLNDQAPGLQPIRLEDWQLPPIPRYIKLYDKYTGREQVLDTSQDRWRLSWGGAAHKVAFPPGATGRLQKTLVVISGAQAAASTFGNHALRILKWWDELLNLLRAGPTGVRAYWNPATYDRAKAECVRRTLTAACRAGVGSWNDTHLSVVKGLRSNEKSGFKKTSARIARREAGVPLDVQAQVAKLLDRAALTPALSEQYLDGLAALALAFQHGVRPVEAIALEVDHVRRVTDSAGQPVVILSFHVAKQSSEAPTLEKTRVVKAEWASLVLRLQDAAC